MSTTALVLILLAAQDGLPPVRTVTLEARDRKLSDLAPELEKATGLKVHLHPGVDPAVTVSLKDATVLQALDEISRAGGASHEVMLGRPYDRICRTWLEGPLVMFGSDTPPVKPTRYVRHYSARAWWTLLTAESDFAATSRTAVTHLQFASSPDVRPLSMGQVRILSIEDDRGRDLILKNSEWTPERISEVNEPVAIYGRVAFRYPEADASKIASLKAQLVVRHGGGRRTASFNTEGASQEVEGETFTLKDVRTEGRQTSVTLVSDGKGRWGREIEKERAAMFYIKDHPLQLEDFALKEENGTVVAQKAYGAIRKAAGGGWEYALKFPVTKSASPTVELTCWTRSVYEVIDFELKDIFLPR